MLGTSVNYDVQQRYAKMAAEIGSDDSPTMLSKEELLARALTFNLRHSLKRWLRRQED